MSETATRPGALGGAAAALGARAAAAGAWAAARPPRRLAALGLLCLLLFLPGIAALPVTDRDEARYAQATTQMLETGEFVDIRFQDGPRWKKPAGIYWMQAASVAAAGGPEGVGVWAWRVPSLIGAVLTVFAAYWALGPLLGARGAFLAAGLTGASLILAAEANIAKTDAMLTGLTTLALGAWIRRMTGAGLSEARPAPRAVALEETEGRGALAAILWGALGLAVLVKGPIAPAVLALAAVWTALSRRSWRPVRALGLIGWGPLLFLAIALPWYVAIWAKTDGAFFAESVGRDLLGKLVEGQEKHGAPPGTYLGVAWAVFFPWAGLALCAAPFVWRERGAAWAAPLLGWAVPMWLLLEAAPTKLPHYVMPLAPALAGLVAAWALREGGAARRWSWIAAAALFGLVGAALGLANLALPVAVGEGLSPWGALLALAGLGAVALGVAALRAEDLRGALAAMALAALTLFPATLQFGLPRTEFGFPSEAMARASAPWAACLGRPAASQSYREPSLVFLQGTDTRLMSVEAAATALREEAGATVWIEDRRRERLMDAFEGEPPDLETLETVTAFNPNRGGITTLRLTARAGDPAIAACRP